MVDAVPDGSARWWARRRSLLRGVGVLGAGVLLASGVGADALVPSPAVASSSQELAYSLPVPGEVLRDFEPPTSAYGPGHRGVDLAAQPGDRVGAAAAGRVAHAGPVAGTVWVSIDHADGIRTAYGPLRTPAVAAGQRVSAGQRLGVLAPGGHGHGHADEGLHLSARRNGVHFDPMTLFSHPGRPSLVGPGARAPGAGATPTTRPPPAVGTNGAPTTPGGPPPRLARPGRPVGAG